MASSLRSYTWQKGRPQLPHYCTPLQHGGFLPPQRTRLERLIARLGRGGYLLKDFHTIEAMTIGLLITICWAHNLVLHKKDSRNVVPRSIYGVGYCSTSDLIKYYHLIY